MCRSRPNDNSPAAYVTRRKTRILRAGLSLRAPADTSFERTAFTLVELLIAMTITSMVTLVLGALMAAVQTAWEHTRGLEDADTQGRAVIDRIKFQVSHAGVYQMAGEPTTLGIGVAHHQWSILQFPDVLVVWSGGREGGMAEAGVQARLPTADEIVVYAVDPTDASRMLEYAFPNTTTTIDFRSAGFSNTILTLLDSADAEPAYLGDRVRVTTMPAAGPIAAAELGNIRFTLNQTPDDDDLAAETPGTAGWNALMWSQGIVGSDWGMRQATLHMELQLEPRAQTPNGTAVNSIALPYFGSTSYRYVYQP